MSITDPFHDEIQAAYRSLDDSLAPPMDAAERIGRRIVVRRRRRRAATAGAGGVAALALVGSVLVLSGGDAPDGNDIATDPTGGQGSTLVMTRPDGSTYAFDDVTVSCKPAEAYGKSVVDQPGHIYMFSPIELSGPVDDNGDNKDLRAVQPFVTFEGIIDKIQGDQTFTFPNAWEEGANSSTDDSPVILFMADTDGNEVASTAGGESGTIRVLEASCSPKPVLRLEVDMTLGSEVEKHTLDIAGSLG
ncbi:hypothetical protein ABLE68_06280 [Nocardioides sp. CN2-186]|uniref:hypothetical protein n=1 Tax=Nocardioides tweenelious TaxID=3156607 RepID=UPI0032B57DC8